jgi:hypothetical protein
MTVLQSGTVAIVTLLALADVGGCGRERATPEVCGQIVDRIVEVELAEQGFRDEALALRKKTEMRHMFDADLRRCAGGKLRAGALTCVRNAKTTEEISHVCLR